MAREDFIILLIAMLFAAVLSIILEFIGKNDENDENDIDD